MTRQTSTGRTRDKKGLPLGRRSGAQRSNSRIRGKTRGAELERLTIEFASFIALHHAGVQLSSALRPAVGPLAQLGWRHAQAEDTPDRGDRQQRYLAPAIWPVQRDGRTLYCNGFRRIKPKAFDPVMSRWLDYVRMMHPDVPEALALEATGWSKANYDRTVRPRLGGTITRQRKELADWIERTERDIARQREAVELYRELRRQRQARLGLPTHSSQGLVGPVASSEHRALQLLDGDIERLASTVRECDVAVRPDYKVLLARKRQHRRLMVLSLGLYEEVCRLDEQLQARAIVSQP